MAGIASSAVLLAAAIGLASTAARAAEGATSNYTPGGYGTVAVAVPSTTGFEFTLTGGLFALERNVTDPLTGLGTQTGVDGRFLATTLTVTSDPFGCCLRIGAGITLPLLSARAALAADTGFGVLDAHEADHALGDISIIPLSLTWASGPLYLNLYEQVFVPTGPYDPLALINLGRNHFSFDTVLAVTWVDAARGFEVSAAAGLIINTSNPATDYRSGAEAHLDVAANMLVTETVGVGLHGYLYHQIGDDSGAGAPAGGFRGRAIGIGPTLTWFPAGIDGPAYLTVRWTRDITARNRLHGDQILATLSMEW